MIPPEELEKMKRLSGRILAGGVEYRCAGCTQTDRLIEEVKRLQDIIKINPQAEGVYREASQEIEKLKSLLQKAEDMTRYYAGLFHLCFRDDKTIRQTIDLGEQAREFLEELKKYREIK